MTFFPKCVQIGLQFVAVSHLRQRVGRFDSMQ